MFEWNPDKDALNQEKHGVSFEEPATVIGDPGALSWEDAGHSVGEYLTLTLG